MYTINDCAGLHGHIKVSPKDGTVYVPNKGCGGDLPYHENSKQAVVVSEDNGLTWNIRQVTTSTGNGNGTKSDPSVGIANDGTVYFGYQANDGHARIAVSRDKGVTWTNDADVGTQVGIENCVFPAVVAGDSDRAAMAFFGTTTPGTNFNDPAFTGVWYLFIARTYDGGRTWATVNATPGDPIQRGGICDDGTCRNLLDFFDATIDKEGRLLVGYDDGCISAGCIAGTSGNDFASKAAIARQIGGKRMFAQYDPGVAPIFSVSPTSVGFGNVSVGSIRTDTLTVSNTGTGTLTISSVSSDNSLFTVTPTSGSIEPSGTQKFAVTFSPSSAGTYAGNITFTHNSSGSPTNVAVNGSGVVTSGNWNIVYHGTCCEGNLAASDSATYVLLPVLLTGNKIERTLDGGKNWARVYPPADISVPFGIEGDLRAYGNDLIFFGTEVTHGVAARSTDGGNSFTVVPIPVAFAANDQAWEYMGPLPNVSPLQTVPYVLTGWYRIGSVALFSFDGGLTWPVQTPLVGVDGDGPAHIICETGAHNPNPLGDVRIPNARFARMKSGRHGGWGTDGKFYWSEATGGNLYICKTSNFGAAWDGVKHPLAAGTPNGYVVTSFAFDDKGTLYVLHANKLYVSFDQGESMQFVHTLPRWGNDLSVGDGSSEFFVVSDGSIHIALKEAATDGSGSGSIWYLRGDGVDTDHPTWTEELVDNVAADRLDFMQIAIDGKGIPTISYTTPPDASKGVTTASRKEPVSLRTGNPKAGTISRSGSARALWCAGPFTEATSAPLGGANCANSRCDEFTLTVGSVNPADLVDVRIEWTNPANDFDLHIYDSNGNEVGKSAGGAPSTSEEASFSAHPGTYSVKVLMYTVVNDAYCGTATLKSGPPPRFTRHLQGGIQFSPNVSLTSPEQPRDGEPSIRCDRFGNVYAAGIRGISSGGEDFFRLETTTDPCFQHPTFVGQPIEIPETQLGGLGGGDIDIAVSQPSDPNAIPVVTAASLALTHVPIAISFDRGQTWERHEVGDLVLGGSPATDRQWITAYGDSTVYLSIRQLASATESDLYVISSTDHGRTWSPRSTVAIGASSTPGYIDVDRRRIGSAPGAGYVYFSHQTDAAMFVSVAPPSPIPGISQTGGPLTFTTYTVDNTMNHGHFFDVVRVGTDGTVYAVWSTDFDIFTTYSTDQGKSWASPVQVNDPNSIDPNGRPIRTNIFPWFVPGDRGRIGVAWFGSNAANNGDNNGDWSVYYAFSSNALSDTVTFNQVRASDHYIHAFNVSESGLGSGAANNRNLLDLFQVDMDPQGAAVMAFADDHNDFQGQPYVTRQIGGPSLLTSVGMVPATSCASVPIDHNPLRKATDPEVIDFRRDAQVGRRTTLQTDNAFDITSIDYSDSVAAGGERQLIMKISLSDLPDPLPSGVHWLAYFTANAPRDLFDRGQSFFVEATTDPADLASANSPKFFYGTVVRRGDGGFAHTRVGSADAGLFDATNNYVQMKIGLGKINAVANPDVGIGTRLIGLFGLTFSGTFSVTLPVLGPLDGSDLERDYTRGGTEYVVGFAPAFAVAPACVNFGSVAVGSSKRDSVTVTNTGISQLSIDSVISDNARMTVTPTSGSVAPSSSKKFYITFTPTALGAQSGHIIFYHNAPGSPDSVCLTGTGYTITAYDCNDTAITQFGGWHNVKDTRATNGYYCRNASGRKSDGAYLSFSFTGFQVDIQIARGPRGGNAQVSIDGIAQGRLEFYRPATDPAHPDKSGKNDLTFGLVTSYPTTQGAHTLRLDVLNDSAGTSSVKRDMDYVDGFLVYGGGTQGTATIRESSTETNGNVNGSGQNSQTTQGSSGTLLMTGVLEVPDGANLDLNLLSPLGLSVGQSTGLNPTEVVRYLPSVSGLFNFKTVNMTSTTSAYTLYVITTKAVVAAPKTQIPKYVEEEKPREFGLDQNYPNPFNPVTVIRYQLPVNSYVSLKVFNVLGQEVAELVDQNQDAGFKSVDFDASRLGSGVYFYKLVAGEFVYVKRMVIIK